jgi:hypothetical protein
MVKNETCKLNLLMILIDFFSLRKLDEILYLFIKDLSHEVNRDV